MRRNKVNYSVNKITSTILIFTLGCFAILASCERGKKDEKEPIEKAKREIEIEKRITKMAKKHNAVINWEKGLKAKNWFAGIYTLKVQNALKREDKRPVLLHATIQDIEKSDNGYLVYFDRWAGYFGIESEVSFPILFILKCPEEQVQKILNQSDELILENYSVIASISEVKKMRFSLTPYSIGEYEAHIEIDSSEVFIARGDCLDLMFIGDNGLSEIQKIMKEVTLKIK